MNRIFSLALLMAFAATAMGQTNTGGNVPYFPNKSAGSVSGVTATPPLTSSGGAAPVIACATCGVTSSPLNQFAATSSAQLASILSDETGTGSVVFANGGAINPASTGSTTPGTVAATTMTATGGVAALSDGVHNGYTSWVGNTADAVVPVNTVGFGGPDTSATGTAYRCNLPWTNPLAGQVLSCGTPNGSGVSQGTWVNPGTSSGLVQVPATTAANTISPTANNVVGLTVNATSGTDSVDVMDVVTQSSGTFGFHVNGDYVVPGVSYGNGGLVAGGTAFGVPAGQVNYSGQTFAQAGCSTLSGSSGGCLVWNVGATTVTAPYFTSPYTPAIYMVNGGAATVATATTIAPTTPLVNLTGTIPIATITLPANFTTGCFNAVPVSTVLTTTAGNIAAIYSLLGGKLYTACYMGSAWYFVGSGI